MNIVDGVGVHVCACVRCVQDNTAGLTGGADMKQECWAGVQSKCDREWEREVGRREWMNKVQSHTQNE